MAYQKLLKISPAVFQSFCFFLISSPYPSASDGAPHQKSSSKSVDAKISTKDIIEVPKDLQDASKRTEKGLRQNISVALQYMGHYLQGVFHFLFSTLRTEGWNLVAIQMVLWVGGDPPPPR